MLAWKRLSQVTAAAAGCFHRHDQVTAGHGRLYSRELEQPGFQHGQHHSATLWRQTQAKQGLHRLAVSEGGGHGDLNRHS